MTRSLIAVAFLGALALTVALADGCNTVTCGQGTVLRQHSDGTTVCEPATVANQLTPCDDVDGGTAFIVGGRCVSRVQCDPGTTMVGQLPDGTQVCVGTGGGGCSCQQPDSTHVCVTGDIYDFTGTPAGKKYAEGEITDPINVGAWEPLGFLNNPNTPALALDTSNPNKHSCYSVSNIEPPSTGLLAIGTRDDPSVTNAKYMIVGVGLQPTAGNIYHRDAYLISKAEAMAWGASYVTGGAFIGQFFDNAVPNETNRTYTSTPALKPAGGVVMLDGASPAAGVKYMMPRTMVGAALTATDATAGTAIAPPPPGLTNYTGMGGMCNGGQACKWQTLPGSSVAGVIFVQDFYSCNYNPAAVGCM